MSSLTRARQDAALLIIARWLGPRMDLPGSAPTGKMFAYRGEGPELIRDWRGQSGRPSPVIMMEGGLPDWAVAVSADGDVRAALARIGVWCEPQNGSVLCLYPTEPAAATVSPARARTEAAQALATYQNALDGGHPSLPAAVFAANPGLAEHILAALREFVRLAARP